MPLDIDQFLDYHKLDRSMVLRELELQSTIDRGSVCLLSGSLAEGLGNVRSDLDLFILEDSNSEEDFNFSIRDVVIDVKFLSRSNLDIYLSELESAWKSCDDRVAYRFAENYSDILHRLLIAQPLTGDEENILKTTIDARFLSDILIRRSTILASALQTDICGLTEDGDTRTAISTAEELLGAAVDCLLGASGNTNPNAKWRWRKLFSRFPKLADSIYRLRFDRNRLENKEFTELCSNVANTIIPIAQLSDTGKRYPAKLLTIDLLETVMVPQLLRARTSFGRQNVRMRARHDGIAIGRVDRGFEMTVNETGALLYMLLANQDLEHAVAMLAEVCEEESGRLQNSAYALDSAFKYYGLIDEDVLRGNKYLTKS
jgi:hypothetical protein